MSRPLAPGWIVFCVVLGPIARAGAEDVLPARMAMDILVQKLPPEAAGAPVACRVDLGTKAVRGRGLVDERSLRLFRVAAEGKDELVPVQFLPDEQPRPPARKLLPGTTPAVSYTSEYGPGEVPAAPGVKGTLTWFARADAGGAARYRLEFVVPRSGSMVQVPYPPQDFRHFDGQGRASPLGSFPRMQVRPQWPLDGKVQVLEANQAVTTYHFGPALTEAREGSPAVRRPFLYPLIGPDGVPLTEFGKAHDPTGSHAHHYSLWIAHASVAGNDFWSEKGGAIAHAGIELLEDGPVFCRIAQKTRWIAGGRELLAERRTWTFFRAAADFRLVDVEIELLPAGSEPVELGKTTFGLLAARVAQSMTPFDGGGEIVNARGKRNEQAAHLDRAEWIDQSGPVAPGDGPEETARPMWNGLAMFDHAENPGFPTAWHCRNDGWAGASLCAGGPRTIRPGEPLRVAYRVLLHRGDAAEGQVARRYAEYAARPEVTVGEARER